MPDFQKLFEASPDAYLVLDADPAFTIAVVNDAYLRATMTKREEIVGRPLFEVFPGNPQQPRDVSVKTLRTSLETVLATRERHELPPLQYDVRRSAAEGGGFEQRFWRACNVPVLGADGAVRQIIHRVEDVTALVRLQQTERDHQRDNETLLARAAAARAEIESRNDELDQTHRELAENRQLLHEARVRLEAAVSAGDIATFIWEFRAAWIHADENLRRWFHLPANSPAKTALSDYRLAFHPDDLPSVQHAVARIRAGQVPPNTEFRLRHGDTWRHVLARARVELDEAGRPARAIGVLLDITELRQTTEALATAREQLLFAAEAAEIGTFSFSGTPATVTFDARCKEHFWLGTDTHEDIELFYSIIHPDDRAATRAAVERAIANREPYDTEYRTISPRGEVRWIHAKGHALYEPGGAASRFDGITIDITRQKQIEATLGEAEARYRLVVESLPDYAIFMLDDTGIVTHWNAGAERLLGYTEAEMIGQSGRILFTPEDQARGEPEKEIETAKSKGCATDDRWHMRKGGERFFVTGLMTALNDAHGRRIGLAKIMRDITDRQHAALERDRLLESERAAREEAERTSRLKDDFLATLSHELRTPLNAILGWTQVLKEGDLDAASIAEGLEIIDRNTHVQAQLIEDLLDISRIISGKVRLKVQPVDLAKIIDAAIDSVRAAADAKHIRLNRRLGHAKTALQGDRTRLQQVVWNLLSNAIKFTPRHGSVEITTENSDSAVILRVSDNGAGISPDFLPHVFERFRQADASTTRRHGGLGLGLSIVKQLVELHGGEIRAESPGLGHGSTFIVCIPNSVTASAPEPPAPPPARATRQRPQASSDLAGLKILVVEDEPDSAHLMKHVLEGHHAEVAAASSMQEALDTFVAFRPDVVLSDIGMPHHDGYEFIRRVRELPGGQQVPAAALSALARREDVERALAAGFRTHLAKPVAPAELIALVAQLAGRAPSPPNP